MRPGTARELLSRRPALLAGAVLAVTWVVSLTVHPWSDESVGDLGVRSGYAAVMLDGELPYRDFRFEYPPLAAPAIALPGLAGAAEDDYRLAIAAFTFLLAVAVMLLVGALARRTEGVPWRAMLAVAAAPLLLGAVVRLHFDLVAVALTLAALLALLVRRPALGLALVALGGMTKGFPLIVAPVALAWLWAEGDRRAFARGLAALAGTLAILGGAWVAFSPEGVSEAFEYQLDRPVQLESSPASFLWGADALGAERPATVDSHATVGLEHPLEAAVGAGFSAALAVAVVALSLLAAQGSRRVRRAGADAAIGYRRAHGPSPDPAAGRALVLAALAAVAAFAALGKVLSPQYLAWVVPLLALALAWRAWVLAAATAAACALTLAEFPSRYVELANGETVAVLITAARNLALFAAVAISAVALLRASPLRRPPPIGETTDLTPAAGAAARSNAPARPPALR